MSDQLQPNKYQQNIKGVTIDIYDLLHAYDVECQANTVFAEARSGLDTVERW